MMSLVERARNVGNLPPSLISEDRVVEKDGFDTDILEVLDVADFSLAPDLDAAAKFTLLLQKADSVDKIPADTEEQRKAALQQRRSILLAIAGNTPRSSPSLDRIISDGYLNNVKLWLDDVLAGSVGSVDFLLHLLSCIVELPVTKSTVKGSGMGKAIGIIEKHSLCKGTPNESVIQDRVQKVKEAWNASVKALKSQDAPAEPPVNGSKRPAEMSIKAESPAKRIKTSISESKPSTSFSSLLKKVSASSSAMDNDFGSVKGTKVSSRKSNETDIVDDSTRPAADVDRFDAKTSNSKKPVKRVKWSDHFGRNLTTSHDVESRDVDVAEDASVSWSDRKKRDRLREKELLANAKKAKLSDDDEEEIEMPKTMQPTMTWRPPAMLEPRAEVTLPNLVSSEILVQQERSKIVRAVRYSSEYNVPDNPAPLSDIEQAVDMTSQSSAVIAAIPFFAPQAALAAPVAAETGAVDMSHAYGVPSYSSVASSYSAGATPEFVQALGLPLFLVGQDMQALQTIANSPSLLSTLVDATGMYDQAKLMNLVQTLSSTGNQTDFQTPGAQYSGVPLGTTAPSSYYGQPTTAYRGAANSDGNMHVSGFGPSTTQAEIIALFAPYVKVDEVVMKGNFAFVNTNDPVNAQIARDALNGTLIGGMPVRINPAQRKALRDTSSSYGSSGTSTYTSSTYGGVGSSAYTASSPAASLPVASLPAPSTSLTQENLDDVRDDRGNPATKNLFIAGYGPGTSEQSLRELVSQFAGVVGVVSKGNFAFVNTIDRASAIHARQMLGGMVVNGGVLRINFAKETGRLGTSFDLTYGPNTGPNRNAPRSAGTNYYGRG